MFLLVLSCFFLDGESKYPLPFFKRLDAKFYKALRLCVSYLHTTLHAKRRSLTKPSQREGCFIVTSLIWPRW